MVEIPVLSLILWIIGALLLGSGVGNVITTWRWERWIDQLLSDARGDDS